MCAHYEYFLFSGLRSSLGKPCFGSRQLKVAEMSGRASAKKRETARKRRAGAVDDQNWSKIARPKKRNSRPLETNGRLTGTKKSLPLSKVALEFVSGCFLIMTIKPCVACFFVSSLFNFVLLPKEAILGVRNSREYQIVGLLRRSLISQN